MRGERRRELRPIRSAFKQDLYGEMLKEPALAVLMVKVFTAQRHRAHIHKIWELLGKPEHRAAYQDYRNTIAGQHLTGEDEVFHSLYFSRREVYERYKGGIPRSLAMGDALAVAYATLKKERCK